MSVVELHDRNTGDYLKENVAHALSRFGIELKQILTITTDNGSNMLRMVNRIDDSVNDLLEESINESLHDSTNEYVETHEVDSEDIENFELQVEADDVVVRKVTSIRCAAHCLQLAVKDACQELQGFFENCRQIIRDLRTPNMYLRITQQGLSHAVLDMPVRWDSTVNMLESLKKLKSFCIANLSSITPDIWSSLDKYLEILEPCRCLSKTFQKEQLNIGDFYISWMRCRHQVAQIDDPFARHLETCMTNRQTILFENDQFVAAIYLDPRVNSSLTTEQMTKARIHLTDIYKRMVQLKEGRRQESEGVSDSTSEPGTSRQGTLSFEDYLRQQFVNNNTNRQQMSNEQSLGREINCKLVEFLQEPILPFDSNIIQYWEKKKLSDPYLFHLARVVLATPATSVSVERLFSSLKFVLNNLRMRLQDYIIEDVMLVRNNSFYSY